METDYEELYKWIEEHPITRPKRNINRDFADALPLVEILKQHFPKLVEVHNYGPKNAHAQKLLNWELLNTKVLKKLKINLSKKRMELLAKGEPGVIEKLLLEIKKKIESHSAGDECSDVVYLEGSASSTSLTNKSRNPKAKQFIAVSVFEKMKADLEEKNEAIEILRKKVEHLENLLDIKEDRIRDLTQQLQSIVNQSSKLDSASQPGKFFSLF